MILFKGRILIIMIMLAIALQFFLTSNFSLASQYDNLRGYASSSVGLLDFNCMNTSCNTGATSTNWGINIAKNGLMSGYASSSVGFINFSPAGPYPSNEYNMQVSSTYSSSTGQVWGWAKNEALGDDGWIELRDAGSGLSGFPYTFDFYFYVPSFGVYVATSTGNFSGYAYGWDDGSPYSWISFNCATEGSCGTLNYNVNLNWHPEPENMSAPNWSEVDACGNGVRRAFLRWDYSDYEGTTQSAYRVVVSTTNNPSSPTIVDTGKVSGTAVQYALDETDLDYGTAYYWWVQVWDADGRPSQLTQYSSASDTDNDDGALNTFTIYEHDMPSVSFGYTPEKPIIGEYTDFVASTTTYGGSSVGSYLWETAADATIGNDSSATTTILFGSYGNQWARLTVSDSDGYSCSYYENIDTNNEVFDFAWSDNVGWISMNCANDASCSSVDYSVKINSAAGTLSGYAWNDEVGWISFEEGTSTPPDNYNFAKNCDADVVCNATNDCTACYNSTDHELYGWAYAISKGANGWISLNCANKNSCATVDYQVSINPSTGKFNGWAWADNNNNADDIGWISFNCANESECGTSDYAVYVFSLSNLAIVNMSAPNWSFTQSCGSLGANMAVFRWTLNGSNQSAYEIVIDDDPVRDDDAPAFDTGKVTSIATQYSCPNQSDACSLSWDRSYFWWARVWDDTGATSTWVQFDTAYGHTITHNMARNLIISSEPSKTFSTYKHPFPRAYLSWDPYDIQPDTITVFSAASSSEFTSGSELSCTSANCSFAWTSEDPDMIIDNNTNATSSLTFSNKVNRAIKLKVTDADGYYCSTSTPEFDSLFNLPTWREVIGSVD